MHLDDNNGKEDLHLPLCSGILTLKKLRELINALKNISYNGPLSLELQQNLHEPVNAMKNSKALITAMLDHY